VFTVTGGEKEMKKVTEYIYGTRLPNTNYELAGSPELERYDSCWLSGDKPEMELWIPIK
jgi:predicted transcriptional regulator YdeE